jgi:nucleotidyltransferase substrate binding protein (TIGR01987 family)
LAWNLIKDYYAYQGEVDIQGSRDAFRTAFQRGLIKNGDNWMKMIKSRALSVYTYNLETIKALLEDITHVFYPEFVILRKTLLDKLEQNE